MKKGEKRKQDLLKIAYNMFLTRGYENTSVDEIIAEAGIAKGTYYYYFKSKEEMLEEVIGMMLESEAEVARQIVGSDMSIPQKIVGIITSLRPAEEERPIENALMQPENVIMHAKIKQKLVKIVVPILSEVVEEGIKEGIFQCEDIPERVRMLLMMSNELFDEADFSESDIRVFIDMTEKLLGAKPGTMGFISALISRGGTE
ncbi:MAG: TetR/AcrR family transcriptional regulator [Lachnospiraceae bacterium]|nr:TetR/AcrR family transcriptional regulator [Lachnospiraceae bacterium]